MFIFIIPQALPFYHQKAVTKSQFATVSNYATLAFLIRKHLCYLTTP
ncbi:hypothetical protein [Moraxella lacunata]